jgi:hypothetical protein
MNDAARTHGSPQNPRWLNRTVLGIGLASLLSDWSHEMATTVMPTLLATIFPRTTAAHAPLSRLHFCRPPMMPHFQRRFGSETRCRSHQRSAVVRRHDGVLTATSAGRQFG